MNLEKSLEEEHSKQQRERRELIRPYFKTLLDNLDKKGLHDAVICNTVRVLQDRLPDNIRKSFPRSG